MEDDKSDTDTPGLLNLENDGRPALNSLILNYYKKFGRKRDLEQYFSLSTAQADIRDPSSQFWQKMKSQHDSSDSSEKRRESPTEVCRISITCSAPEPSTSQDERYKQQKQESESPPIITEDAANRAEDTDNESVNSDDRSPKSIDATLDTSTNKPLSPTSSVTSQRKLEWDSLADVGYANESDRKTSSSGLSTVERLALKQQVDNDDKDIEIGPPTAHSTMVHEQKGKSRKGRVTEIHSKDVDVVELNMPHSKDKASINVNLTKHISFNVEKDGEITVEKRAKDVSVNPAKVSVETEVTPKVQLDKEIQTTLVKSVEVKKNKKSSKSSSNGAPVFISLNTLRRRIRKKRKPRRSQSKKSRNVPKDISAVEKSGEVVSEAESFEYMPGHMFNQNQGLKLGNSAGNKSSLESSGGLTTESSNLSFTQDLERSIGLLQKILQQNKEDSNLKKQLIKDLVKKLVTTRYKDDTSTDFLSGLSLSSKRLGLGRDRDYKSTTTSTSDANNSHQVVVRPKKSILRTEKFNANAIASTSQSTPNLAAVSCKDPPTSSNFKNSKSLSSHTESDVSSKETKSSQELYNKYLDALRREAYKKHLRNKEKLLKEKLVGSEGAIRQLVHADSKSKRLRDLMKDLTRKNYNDGSGDASKLEGGSHSGNDNEVELKKHRSHSVFTLSSNNSDKKGEDDKERRKIDLRNRLQEEIEARLSSKDRPIKHHYCCCPHHSLRQPTDSSLQVNIPQESNHRKESMHFSEANPCGQVKTDIVACGQYASCVCSGRGLVHNQETCNCKCNNNQVPISKIASAGAHCGFSEDSKTFKFSNRNCAQISLPQKRNDGEQFGHSKETNTSPRYAEDFAQPSTSRAKDVEVRHVIPNEYHQRIGQKTSQSSQTNVADNLIRPRSSGSSTHSSSAIPNNCPRVRNTLKERQSRGPQFDVIQESTRWTQTDLSFLPRAVEVSLSDLKIVSEDECAKLVSQTYREVPTPMSKEKGTDTADNAQDAIRELNETHTKHTCANHNEAVRSNKQDIAIQSNLELNDNGKGNGDSYTIPLKGTNMTLLVSVGSNAPNTFKEVEHKNEGVQSNNANYNINTNPNNSFQEHNKAEQCQSDFVFDKPCDRGISASSNADANIDLKSLDRNKVTFSKQSEVTNLCTSGSNRFSTYPKEQKKLIIRSNTDGMLSEKAIKEPSMKPDSEMRPDTKHVQPKTGDYVDGKNDSLHLKSDCSKSSKNYNSSKPVIINSRSSSPTTKEHKSIAKKTEQRDQTAKSSLETDTLKIARTNNKNKAENKSTSENSENKEQSACKNNDDHKCGKACDCGCKTKDDKDPALEIIRDITKRYSKQDLRKDKRKECFKEIMSVLNYLLDTDDSADGEDTKRSRSADNGLETKLKAPELPKEETPKKMHKTEKVTVCTATSPKRLVDKGVQLIRKKSRSKTVFCESSDVHESSDLPTTSSDTITCNILKKIKQECEKYHQKRCKCSSKRCEGTSKRCVGSSTTSVSCEDCKKVHHCNCRAHNQHKCKHRTKPDKVKKPCVAYNLIIQTSDSFVGDETCDNKRQLKNIVFKVPSKKHCGIGTQDIPFNEMASKLEEYANSKRCPQMHYKFQRSKSLPNESEISSTDDVLKRCPTLTVRDYLEKNRPDFIANTSTRQNCLKMISESRASQRASQRELLSLQLQRGAALSISAEDIRRLAREVGHEIRRRRVAPKLISEREMKQRSEQIYKSLPEVAGRQAAARLERNKRTNLLMASIFKKNLQKKTLRGFVNLSNYSPVVRI